MLLHNQAYTQPQTAVHKNCLTCAHAQTLVPACNSAAADVHGAQNMLTAVMYKHEPTGYKDPKDPANRNDKRNGGEFRRFER